jgi:hypothetical protein
MVAEVAIVTMDQSKPPRPGTLRALERVVETHARKGAEQWRIAADALLEIKNHKLWKLARNADGEPFANFIEYAETRFGFKKTYAYDLAKAALHKPSADSEGAARAAIASERGPSPLSRDQATRSIVRHWERFEDRAGDIRDRTIDDGAFVKAYDNLLKRMDDLLRAFEDKYTIIEGSTTSPAPEEAPATT